MGIRTLVGTLALAAALTAAPLATATEPSETTTFGTDGIALASLGTNYLRTGVVDVTARADGGLVVQRTEGVETFLPNGSPDPTAPPSPVAKDRRLFPAGGGKSFVVEGEHLTRLNPDGTPDTSFGGAGTVKVPLYGAQQVLELGSGRIALFATSLVGTHVSSCQVEITDLNADGSTAAGAGFQTTLPIERDCEIADIVPTPGGGALMVDKSFLLELLPDGTLDTAFGKNGVVYATGLASAHVLADGSIEAVGRSYEGSSGQALGVFRFTAAGAPDSSFAPEGIRRFPIGGEATVNAASWAADGSVVVAGKQETDRPCPEERCATVPLVAAINAAGNLETGFGEGGVVRLSTIAGPAEPLFQYGAQALTRRPDGSIVVAGNGAPGATVAFLAALTPAGQLIPAFGEGGVVRLRTPVPAGQALSGISPLPDGGAIAVGVTELNDESTPVLIRYAADGSLDPGFGNGNGYLALGPSGSRRPRGLAINGEEALTSMGGKPSAHLLMYGTADGSPVAGFGGGGSVALPAGAEVKALAFTTDGEALVLAKRQGGGSELLRYLADGDLDDSFGHGGRALLRLPDGSEVEASSLAVTATKIIVGGISRGHFTVAVLHPDGTPERHFGGNGWRVINGGDKAQYQLATPTRVGSRIYLAGCTEDGEERDRIVLMRLRPNGRLDRGFGHLGRLSAGYSRGARPELIIPGRRGVRVVLDIGWKTILTFSPHGGVRRAPPGAKPEFVRNVVGSVGGGQVFLGWSHFSSETIKETSYISKRPLSAGAGARVALWGGDRSGTDAARLAARPASPAEVVAATRARSTSSASSPPPARRARSTAGCVVIRRGARRPGRTKASSSTGSTDHQAREGPPPWFAPCLVPEAAAWYASTSTNPGNSPAHPRP